MVNIKITEFLKKVETSSTLTAAFLLALISQSKEYELISAVYK